MLLHLHVSYHAKLVPCALVELIGGVTGRAEEFHVFLHSSQFHLLYRIMPVRFDGDFTRTYLIKRLLVSLCTHKIDGLNGDCWAMSILTATAWNEPSQLGDLLARFQYMFPLGGSERIRAYVFFRGWMPVFGSLCEQIDARLGDDKRGFEWLKIREKFGAPSFAYNMRGRARHAIHSHRPSEVHRIDCAPSELFEPLAVAVQELVLEAELQLRQTCMNRPGFRGGQLV